MSSAFPLGFIFIKNSKFIFYIVYNQDTVTLSESVSLLKYKVFPLIIIYKAFNTSQQREEELSQISFQEPRIIKGGKFPSEQGQSKTLLKFSL